jgi:hypothetical protein
VKACLPCHRDGGPAGATRYKLTGELLADLAASRLFVDRVVPTESILLTKAAGRAHGGGAPWPAESAGQTAVMAWLTSEAAGAHRAIPDGQPASTPVRTDPGTPGPPMDRTPSPPSNPTNQTAAQPHGLAFFGDTLTLNGRFDVNVERRNFQSNPWGQGSATALQSYHHFLFLGRQSADDPFTLTAEVTRNKEGMVPQTCARCHSSEGFVDYLGGDNSVPGLVDKPAPIESVIRCATCHTEAAETLTSVTFPSGARVDGLGRDATCMTCHQGRASGADVDKIIMASGATGEDTASPMISFTNIHYYPAAATLFAGRARGGYQYPGEVYDTRFRHVDGFNTCTGCHDPHSARPRVDACAGCHAGVKDLADLRMIRMMSSSNRDYDGDSDVREGVYHELAGLKDKLLDAIRRYGVEKNAPLCYKSAVHPYWFQDGNGDGACSTDELVSTNGYKSWTARLAKAAFNYQMASKDPGAFAHNAKYIMELLFDSLTSMNAALVVKINMDRAVRGDRGHFDGSSEAARHWDSEEGVDATCSRCHSGQTGFRFFTQHGVTIEVPETANGLECGTCHTSFGQTWNLLEVKATVFPGGTTSMLAGNDNLCSNCHSGRVGKADIDRAITANRLTFQNVHYLPAAATRQGAAAKVGYEYDGKTYAGSLRHTGGVQCTSCHDPVSSQHGFLIEDA